MSHIAVQHFAQVEGLSPNAKLVLVLLAAMHNARTGQCNPSYDTLSRLSGLNRNTIGRTVVQLAKAGHLTHAGGRFMLHMPAPETKSSVPHDFWPSDEAINTIFRRYPLHLFHVKEAVDDFIKFAHDHGLQYPPDRLNEAFVTNICAILDTRQTGPIAFDRGKQRERSESVGALLSGSR